MSKALENDAGAGRNLSGRTTSIWSFRITACRSSSEVNAADSAPLPEQTGLPLVVDERCPLSAQRATAKMQDVLLCIQTGKTDGRPRPPALCRRRNFIIKSEEEMPRPIRRRCRRRYRQYRGDRRGAAMSSLPSANTICRRSNTRRATTAGRYFDKALPGTASNPPLPRWPDRLPGAAGVRDADDPQDGLCGLFPHRGGFCAPLHGGRRSRWARGAALPPGRWSLTVCRSRTWIR